MMTLTISVIGLGGLLIAVPTITELWLLTGNFITGLMSFLGLTEIFMRDIKKMILNSGT